MYYKCNTFLSVKQKVPDIIPFRTTPEDKELIQWLLAKLKPRNMAKLIRAGLECLREKELNKNA